MKFKLKNIVLVSLLAVAGIFGASAAVFSKSVNETPIAEKVEATNSGRVTGGDTVYFVAKNNWARVDVYFWGGTGSFSSWPGYQMTKVGTFSTYGLFAYTIPTGTNPGSLKFNSNGYDKGMKDISLTDSKGYGCNTLWSDSGNQYLDVTICKINKKKLLGSTETDIGTEYISGTSWTVTKQEFVSGYQGNGWYKNDKTTPISGTYTGCDWNTTVYSKYTSHAAWEGTINLDLSNSGWAGAGASYAVLLMDKSTYTTEQDAWSTYVTGTAANVRLVQIPYSSNFEPKEMHVVRYNPSKSDWNTQKWTNLWGQTSDIYSFSTMVRIGDTYDEFSNNNAYLGYPKVMGGSTWTTIGYLTNVKLNESNNVEYYGKVSLSTGTEFKIQRAPYADGDYRAQYIAHSDIASNFSNGGDANITTVTGGTYNIYFDEFATYGSSKKIYITTEVIEWSQYFLDTVGCDATGITLPTGWSSCASSYSGLSSDAKNTIYSASANPNGKTVEKAVARYDHAVSAHPSLTRFIVNSGSTPRAAYHSSFSPFSLFGSEDNFSTIIIIISSSVALLSVTALSILVIRKRKSKEIE